MQVTITCGSCGKEILKNAEGLPQFFPCPSCGELISRPVIGVGPGTQFNGFRIEEKIGSGAMGVVYRATQIAMDRKVAIKILPPALTYDPDTINRFMREVRTLAKIEHPNIVTAFDAGETSGLYYLAMTYVDGETLEELIKREGKIGEAEALRITRCVAKALQCAWEEHQLLHNDVKPGNVMLDRKGNIKLMDLGLSKAPLEHTGMTMTGTAIGTPNFMSPEQASGCKELDFRSDQYALGATLYRLLAGELPHSGTSVTELLTKKLMEPVPPIRKRNPEVSEACEHLLAVMLAREPEQRHASWEDLIRDIDQVIASMAPSTPRPPEEETMMMKLDARLNKTMQFEEVVDPNKKRRTPLIVGVIVIAVLALGAVAIWMMQSSQDVVAQAPLPQVQPAVPSPVAQWEEPAPAEVMTETVAKESEAPESFEPIVVKPQPPKPEVVRSWSDRFGGAGSIPDPGKWSYLETPRRDRNNVYFDLPTIDWAAEGLVGNRLPLLPITSAEGVDARITLTDHDMKFTDPAFLNAGYIDLVLCDAPKDTAFISDDTLAVLRLHFMADGSIEFQCGVKFSGEAQANENPIWLKDFTPIDGIDPQQPLQLILRMFLDRVEIAFIQHGKLLLHENYSASFPFESGHGVGPMVYLANQAAGRVSAWLDDFQVSRVGPWAPIKEIP